MNGRGHSFFPIIVLALLAAAGFWLERITQQEPTPPVDHHRHDSDFMVDHFTLRRFDLNGKTQYVLVGDHMTHYGDDESTELVRPRLDYLNRPEPMHVESERATVSKDGEVIVMNDKVFARREAHADKPESTLSTEQMTVWPDDEKMRTDTPVTLTMGQTVITAEHMESDNIMGEVRLSGTVRGTLYRTQARKP
jgi:lipopolysaccharide export system protein LptC